MSVAWPEAHLAWHVLPASELPPEEWLDTRCPLRPHGVLYSRLFSDPPGGSLCAWPFSFNLGGGSPTLQIRRLRPGEVT